MDMDNVLESLESIDMLAKETKARKTLVSALKM